MPFWTAAEADQLRHIDVGETVPNLQGADLNTGLDPTGSKRHGASWTRCGGVAQAAPPRAAPYGSGLIQKPQRPYPTDKAEVGCGPLKVEAVCDSLEVEAGCGPLCATYSVVFSGSIDAGEST